MPNITNTNLRFQGPYTAVQTYVFGDLVTYAGGTYALKIGSSTGVAPTNTTAWSPLAPAGSGIPTGGGTGQVLSKLTGNDYETQWSTPSAASGEVPSTPVAAVPFSASSVWYSTAISAIKPLLTWTPTVGVSYYVPFVTTQTMTVVSLGVSVSTGAASTAVLGICNSTAAGAPGTLLVTGTTASNSTAATTYSATGLSAVIPPGLLYFAFLTPTAAPTYFAYTPHRNFNGISPTGGPAANHPPYTMYAYNTVDTVIASDPSPVVLQNPGPTPVFYYRATS